MTEQLDMRPKPPPCPAYDKQCACPVDSRVRQLCQQTAAQKRVDGPAE